MKTVYLKSVFSLPKRLVKKNELTSSVYVLSCICYWHMFQKNCLTFVVILEFQFQYSPLVPIVLENAMKLFLWRMKRSHVCRIVGIITHSRSNTFVKTLSCKHKRWRQVVSNKFITCASVAELVTLVEKIIGCYVKMNSMSSQFKVPFLFQNLHYFIFVVKFFCETILQNVICEYYSNVLHHQQNQYFRKRNNYLKLTTTKYLLITNELPCGFYPRCLFS